jgi:hypothetical protein
VWHQLLRDYINHSDPAVAQQAAADAALHCIDDQQCFSSRDSFDPYASYSSSYSVNSIDSWSGFSS